MKLETVGLCMFSKDRTRGKTLVFYSCEERITGGKTLGLYSCDESITGGKL